ncbi:calcium/sodium antiporter [Coraliomargarita akajimensis]|uniref:Na+/Ca+ antiporter, CaCA family n=1 Tax=Coraliomargarita akajimensis (strain DSM 45221 / IAM 15411 / JCM 23193 / KCTC 12865 / 04OKA010-24) TaxID=583355 RepID=D5EQT8_CORAD|nr:calcium/sodium antiporter [Coraliomargarita akajimensis]ADE53931.1 Na+/Ca+ antiporter, CaCA family [Coraliomargarita akajimensis DSM 45221]
MTLALINLPVTDFAIWALLLMLLAGFAALSYGGDYLTQGAAAVSVNMKIDPIVVGLTVVSIATSMPEMATSLMAAKDNPGLALGNILGSNIANIGLILGVAAVIAPLKIELRLIRREVPILIIVTLLFAEFALGGGFHQVEGMILLSLTVVYLVYVVRGAKATDSESVSAEFAEGTEPIERKSTPMALVLIVFGGALLALGADLLVSSSVEIAGRMGASDLFIGLTIVAIGTSLPELAASIAAVRSGHGDLCAGNIVGSNLFNMLLIGGGVSAVAGMDVKNELLLIEFPALILLSALLLWMFKSGHTVSRREGVCLLLLYFTILSVSALSQFGYIF